MTSCSSFALNTVSSSLPMSVTKKDLIFRQTILFARESGLSDCIFALYHSPKAYSITLFNCSIFDRCLHFVAQSVRPRDEEALVTEHSAQGAQELRGHQPQVTVL